MKLVKNLLPVLAVIYLASCNTTVKPKEQPAVVKPTKERILFIPRLKDRNSTHNRLRVPLPYTFKMGPDYADMLPDSIKGPLTGEYLMEVQADSTFLHVKGDSCWLEYISAGTVHAKRKDGTIRDMPGGYCEISDTVLVHGRE